MTIKNARVLPVAAALATALAGLLPGTAAAQFAYAPTNYSRLYGFHVDAATGVLAPIAGSPFQGAGYPAWSVTTPSGKFLYTVDTGTYWIDNRGYGGIYGYRIDTITGALSPTGYAPARGGVYTSKLAMDPAGKFLYAINYNTSDISVFAVNDGTGELTEVPGSRFATGPIPMQLTVHSNGNFLYVSSWNSETISGFTVNRNTGYLTPMPGSPYSVQPKPTDLTVHPAGRYLYVVSSTNTLRAYAIDQATGVISPVGQGFPAATGDYPVGLASDPTGRFLYVANQNSKNVSAYTVDAANGRVTEVAGSPFANGEFSWVVAPHPNGKFLYVVNYYPGTISAYSIHPSTGALTRISGSPFAAYQYTSSLVFAETCQATPQITGLRATPDALWPPNGKMTPVSIGYTATSPCGGVPVCTLSVSANEPLGSGDAMVTGAHEVMLRADRDPQGVGRVYTTTVTCRDSAGRSASQTVSVLVPHDHAR